MPHQRVVVLGGSGVFGRIIAAQLAPHAELVIAGRDPAHGEPVARRLGATFARCDLHSPQQLRATLAGAALVVHAAGPFNDPAHPVALAALAAGAHYIDIADEPGHVTGIGRLDPLARERGLCLSAGASTTPAVTAAMVRALTVDGLVPERIAAAISPGNRNPRGSATVGAILRYVGEPVCVTVGGERVERRGWGDGELVVFPAPVGRRSVYTVDTPDSRLFPAYFGARTVTFKAGLELQPMNWALATAAGLRQRGLIPNLAGYAGLLTTLSKALYPLGSPHGAVAVWVEGRRRGRPLRRGLALVARHDGPSVAAAPAALLARRILAGDIPAPGAAPCLNLVEFAELAEHLAASGITAVWGDEAGWR